MFNVTLQFETGKVSYGKSGKSLWTLTKDFNGMRHLDNFIDYIHRTKGYLLDECFYNSGYPFEEGDTYYTVEKNSDGTYEVVESTWDDVSEDIYDEDNRRYLTWSKKNAYKYATAINRGSIKIISEC